MTPSTLGAIDFTASSALLRWFKAGWSRGSRAWSGASEATLDLLFPASCLWCQAPFETQVRPALCGECRTALAGRAVPRCGHCGARTAMETLAGDGCGLCQQPWLKFDAAVVLGSYEAPLRNAVLRCKRPHHDLLAAALGELLAEEQLLPLSRWLVDAVLPVPMHWRHRIWRGTNSPDQMASAIARRLQVKCIPRGVTRRRPTKPQSSLQVAERRKNVRGAFAASRAYDWQGTRVLLVDDIMTTGHTCSEIATVLKEAGAAAVHVAVVARAQGNL